MANLWAELAGRLDPDAFENLVERVFSEYNQAFKPVSVDFVKKEVVLELKDGRKIREQL